MKTEKDILNELESLGAGILLHRVEMPFTVAAGYFEGLPAHLMNTVSAAVDFPAGEPLKEEAHFSVPEGYFEGFVHTVLAAVKAEQAEDVMPDLPRVAMPYAIADKNYFNTFGEQVLRMVSHEEPVLSLADKRMPYVADSSYFTAFPAYITEMAAEHAAAPVLLGAGKGMPYALPERYFEQSVPVIPVTEDTPENVVSFVPPRKKKAWTQWGIAASVALMVTVGLTLTGNRDAAGDGFQHSSIDVLAANISKESIDEYINVHLDDFVSTKMTASMEPEKLGKRDKDRQIQTIIENITTEDIDTYLDIIE